MTVRNIFGQKLSNVIDYIYYMKIYSNVIRLQSPLDSMATRMHAM